MNKKSWIGFSSLYFKEVKRFLVVYNQTIVAPVINAMLLLLIFTLTVKNHKGSEMIMGVDFSLFVGAGLMGMGMIQNGFANTSSSLIQNKIMGSIVDYLTPPFTTSEFLIAICAAGVTRAIMVFSLTGLLVKIFIGFSFYSFPVLLFYVFFTSFIVSMTGMLAGLFAESFDGIMLFTNYLIVPFSFLAGTFYYVPELPKIWYVISKFNPFFYMITGVRYGITGIDRSDAYLGMLFLVIFFFLFFIFLYRLIKIGYGIKT